MPGTHDDSDDGDETAALAALGVTVRDTSELEAEYRADWERAAEERRQRKQGIRPAPPHPALAVTLAAPATVPLPGPLAAPPQPSPASSAVECSATVPPSSNHTGAYFADYAKMGRAKCRVCGEVITLKSLRVGLECDEQGWGVITKWQHPACTRLPRSVVSSEIVGFDTLTVPDQERIEAMLLATGAPEHLEAIDPAEEVAPVASAPPPARAPHLRDSAAPSAPPPSHVPHVRDDADEDAALARALSSQRSERISVAHRRASGVIARSSGKRPRRGDDDDDDRSDDEDYRPDDADDGVDDEEGDEDEDEDGLASEVDDDDELEEGEIAPSRPRAGKTKATGALPHGARKRRHVLARRLEETPYGSSDEDAEDEEVQPGILAPGRLWKHLFEHQRVCLEWMSGLHTQQVGGIMGDDMGLGKTLQVVSLFATLQHSGKGGTCLVVAPATVLRQWQREFRRWAPEIATVAVLHSSGGVDASERVATVRRVCSAAPAANGGCAVLITSYEMMRIHASVLLAQRWQYVVLDEGHKIRNPDAEVTLVAKRFNTCHRLILTGAPIQNKLNELWSLFDFVYPGRLGTLPTFDEQFSLPIASGAYANASAFKVQAAYQCSVVLRDLIRPYLLRRTKADVQLGLPEKSEQVLFCQLTDDQREAYEKYLQSDIVARVLSGRANAFVALTSVLKVCNHPHLLTWEAEDQPDGTHFGDWRMSGKMRVLRQVLRLWHGRGDRALVFCQTRQMLNIVQAFVSQLYVFRRLDGTTPVSSRLHVIDEYNADPSIFVFLLTTRAGGLGVNLTGANRVLLVDPDWNPANDLQARERAYRIGQQRAVTVYRLVTAGTLEEKVYQRQVFKQVLSNNVLKDPKQTRRVFKHRDLRDLLAPPSNSSATEGTETGDLFATAEHVSTAHASSASVVPAPSTGGSVSNNGAARAEVSEDVNTQQPAANANGETGFLSQLLRGELVATALDHDAVIGDAARNPMNKTAAVEAKRVAERAASSLRESYERRRQEQVNVPTWTGRSGGAGLPRRFGSKSSSAVAQAAASTAVGARGSSSSSSASYFVQGQVSSGPVDSASLLQRIRDRKEATGEADPEAAQASRLLQRLCEYIARNGGRVSSAQLVAEFQGVDVDARLLKVLLKEAAEKDGGHWKLRPAFQR